MTQQEIQERNKAIALLRNYKYFRIRVDDDWEWLMCIVKFIENLGYNVEICSYHGNSPLHYCAIHKLINKDTNDVISIVEPKHSNDKKEAVFIAVSDFAKLYNEKLL